MMSALSNTCYTRVREDGTPAGKENKKDRAIVRPPKSRSGQTFTLSPGNRDMVIPPLLDYLMHTFFVA